MACFPSQHVDLNVKWSIYLKLGSLSMMVNFKCLFCLALVPSYLAKHWLLLCRYFVVMINIYNQLALKEIILNNVGGPGPIS